ncbi:hypothetical protein CEXT_222671 [Caerostris extrusa]|uniref:Uncharacterized protein n=1 Tax=Caerostris extrusa TaxID=172846 RepID=A0AAV4TFA4_CAEEX|nr:hypothetical protein CEXT_222671 [Caerostris extrusa]
MAHRLKFLCQSAAFGLSLVFVLVSSVHSDFLDTEQSLNSRTYTQKRSSPWKRWTWWKCAPPSRASSRWRRRSTWTCSPSRYTRRRGCSPRDARCPESPAGDSTVSSLSLLS